MQITVNGKSETLSPCSIIDLIISKGLKPESVVVEHNYKIVKREVWSNVFLKENDNLEVISMVGGG